MYILHTHCVELVEMGAEAPVSLKNIDIDEFATLLNINSSLKK